MNRIVRETLKEKVRVMFLSLFSCFYCSFSLFNSIAQKTWRSNSATSERGWISEYLRIQKMSRIDIFPNFGPSLPLTFSSSLLFTRRRTTIFWRKSAVRRRSAPTQESDHMLHVRSDEVHTRCRSLSFLNR